MTGEGETIVYHGGGKLVEKVSYSTWDKGDSSRQETIREWVPIRRGAMVYHSGRKLFAVVSYSTWEMGIHSDRKLFAYSFLSGMGRLRIIVTGNY